MIKIIFTSISVFLTSFIFGQETESTAVSKSPNIILLIGDGMGLSQLSSAYFYGDSLPNFSRFENIGLSITSSGSHKITDSAAGATAFSCGKKTFNGAIGVDIDSSSVETIVETVSNLNWSTGIISTSSITHATPASFYAHVNSRNDQLEIARQLVYSEVDFYAGGGTNFFINRLDDHNLLDSLTAQNFKWDTTGFSKKELNTNDRYVFLLDGDGLKAKHEGRGDDLLTASSIALAYLSKKDSNFFCMIEGSQIDWGGHNNDANYIAQEVLDFDEVIGAALDFAVKDGNTLVIVTADHETGGYTLSGEARKGPANKTYNDYNKISPTFSTGGHSATLVPVFAFGPGSEHFRGVYENTEIYYKMMALVKRKW